MGLSYRRRRRLGRHAALNVSNRGVGLSLGVRGARVAFGAAGSLLSLSWAGVRFVSRLGR